MTYIASRRTRVMPGELADTNADADAATDTSAGPGGFDYASLLRGRPAPHRLVTRGETPSGETDSGSGESESEGGVDEDASPAAFDPFANDEPLPAISGTSLAVHSSSVDNKALEARVAHAAAAVVSSVFMQQQRVIELVGTLAREIAGFCSDRAIADAGNWNVQMPLDARLLPHTTLYLTLSRFAMQLRFDAPDPATKQLLLDHSALLERELDTMLRAWGEARDIELTVW